MVILMSISPTLAPTFVLNSISYRYDVFAGL